MTTTNKLQLAAEQTLEALEELHYSSGTVVAERKYELATAALREALDHFRDTTKKVAEQAEQEPFDMNDHPPHRLCECRKCMEYFTPLPDCDAFAASGKPIAEQEPVRKCDGLLCNDCGEYKQRYKDLPGITEKDLCVCDQAAPVQQVDLTDDEIEDVWARHGTWGFDVPFARAVIAAYKEKNK